MTVPCQQCVGCRLERARQWAVRCEHEMRRHDRNCFITLTFDDDHLPDDGSICVRDMQLFMKRLRKKFGAGVKHLYCGEYGEENWRPHYHAILFNCDFPDRKVFKRLASGFTIDTSAILGDLWPYGFSSVGAASFESAAYVASYCLKKVTGELAEGHYYREIKPNVWDWVEPEFARMSKGIGLAHLLEFSSDIYPANVVVTRGGRVGVPPRYYAKKFAELSDENARMLDDIKEQRALMGAAEAWNSTPERLAVREQVRVSRLQYGRKGDL